MSTLQTICDVIILVGAVVVAITNILKFFGKPIDNFSKRGKEKKQKEICEIMKEELPKMLDNEKITQIFINSIKPSLDKLEQINTEQNQKIDILAKSSKDVLREKIMSIYNRNKLSQSLTQYEHEALEQYFKDYKAEKGNSYIDKYKKRMNSWTILQDNYNEI